MVLVNDITDNNEDTPQSFSENVSFTVTVIDPCDTATMTPLALSAQTIVNGDSYTWTFSEAVFDVETANEDQRYCGTRQYNVYLSDGVTEVTGDWMTLTGDYLTGYTLVAEPIDETLVTGASLDLVLKITLIDQPDNAGYTETMAVEIIHATCDCSLLLWDNPAMENLSVSVSFVDTLTIPEATVNVPSRSTTPAIRRCYDDSPCDETYTTDLVDVATGSLPGFMDYTGTDLTVTPTVAADIGTYELQLTMTTTAGTSPVYIAVTVDIPCTITAIENPASPATQTYYVYGANFEIDLSATVYIQTPPCEWPATNTFSWEIPADG